MNSKKVRNLEKGVAQEIALQEFSKHNCESEVQDKHEFSEEFMSRKSDLLERAMLLDVQEKDNYANNRIGKGVFIMNKKMKNVIKVSAAVAACAIIIPTSVFAANKFKAMKVEREGYQANVSFEQEENEAYDGYIKLNYNYIPKEMYMKEKDFKFGSDTSEADITIDLSKAKGDFTLNYTTDVEEFDLNGSKGYYVKNDIQSDQVYFQFKGYNYMLHCFVNDVSKEELYKFLENISVERCSKDEATVCGNSASYLDNRSEEEVIPGAYDIEKVANIWKIGDTVKNPAYYHEDDPSVVVEDVTVKDDVKGLNIDYFIDDDCSEEFYSYIKKTGKIPSNTRVEVDPGDGVNTISKTIGKEDVDFKLVLVKFKVKNNSDEDMDYSAQYSMKYITENDGKLIATEYTSKNTFHWEKTYFYGIDNACYFDKMSFIDSSIFENQGNGNQPRYNNIGLKVGEEKEVTQGFLVAEDKLDEMFIDVCGYGRSCNPLTRNVDGNSCLLIDIRQ